LPQSILPILSRYVALECKEGQGNEEEGCDDEEADLRDDINPRSSREPLSEMFANIELCYDGAFLSCRACGVQHEDHRSGKMLHEEEEEMT
jgi:hypothetical protein